MMRFVVAVLVALLGQLVTEVIVESLDDMSSEGHGGKSYLLPVDKLDGPSGTHYYHAVEPHWPVFTGNRYPIGGDAT